MATAATAARTGPRVAGEPATHRSASSPPEQSKQPQGYPASVALTCTSQCCRTRHTIAVMRLFKQLLHPVGQLTLSLQMLSIV